MNRTSTLDVNIHAVSPEFNASPWAHTVLGTLITTNAQMPMSMSLLLFCVMTVVPPGVWGLQRVVAFLTRADPGSPEPCR